MSNYQLGTSSTSNSKNSSRQLQLPFLLAFNYGLYEAVSLFQNNGFKLCSVVLCTIMTNRNIWSREKNM